MVRRQDKFIGGRMYAHQDTIWGLSWTVKDTVISISADGGIYEWDASGQPIRNLPRHTLGLVSLSVSASGEHALFNSVEGVTKLWDLNTGEIIGIHEGYAKQGSEPSEPAWSVSLHPSGTTYASTGASGNVNVYSADRQNFGEHISKLESGRSKFGMCTVHSPDGSRIALSAETGQIYIFDTESSSLVSTYTSHAMTVRSLAWSADSQMLLSGSDDKRLILHDVRTSSGKPGSGAVASFSGHSSWVLSTSISTDGRLALSGSADKTVKVWDIGARAAVSTNQETGEVWGVAWRPRVPSAGSIGAFVTGGDDGTVKWWRSAGAS